MGWALTFALVWLAACGGGDPQRRELVDDGEVCLRLQASGTLQVNVVFHVCLNSCDIAQPVSCDVFKQETEGGPVVRVASRGAVETTGGSVCSPDCGKLRAACMSTDTFAPGKYSVVHGEDTADVLLGVDQQCLFRE